MKTLIVNADDFGRHELINRGIERAIKFGILKSATIMAGGIAFDDAINIARKNPSLGLGIHFTLVNGTPSLPPNEIPTLVTEDGVFYDNYIKFLQRYFSDQISREEIRAELAAQLEKIVRTGLQLTHFDSHQHLHHLPGIIDITMRLASSEKISAMRVARVKIFDGKLKNLGQFIGRVGLNLLAKYVTRHTHGKNFITTEHFTGLIAGGVIDENFLLKLINDLDEDRTEIMMHIGTDNKILKNFCAWDHDFEGELAAVTSTKILQVLNAQNISTTKFQ